MVPLAYIPPRLALMPPPSVAPVDNCNDPLETLHQNIPNCPADGVVPEDEVFGADGAGEDLGAEGGGLDRMVPPAGVENVQPAGVPDDAGENSDADGPGEDSDADGPGEDLGSDSATESDCGIEEEECENLREEFGVHDNNEAVNADVQSDEDSDYERPDDDKIPEPLVPSDDEETETQTRRHDEERAGDEIRLGKCYGTPEDFKLAVLKYSLRTRYDIKLYKSQSQRIGAKCNDSEGKCEWKCYASYERRKHMMQVKIFIDVHTCVRSGYSRLLKQGPVCWLFEDRLRENPKLTKYEMAAEIKRDYGLIVSDEICGRARTALAKKRRQSHEAHFNRIWDYQAEVLQSNEDSTFDIETVPGPRIGSKQRFDRLYMCFKAQKETWKKTCRPVIGVDGAFLRWDIKGHMLAAVGRDGDDRIVPIAWAVVEIESEDNWVWFLSKLSKDLAIGDGSNYSIISDKQKV